MPSYGLAGLVIVASGVPSESQSMVTKERAPSSETVKFTSIEAGAVKVEPFKGDKISTAGGTVSGFNTTNEISRAELLSKLSSAKARSTYVHRGALQSAVNVYERVSKPPRDSC